MEIVDFLARAGKFAAPVDQAARFFPLLQAHRLENVLMECFQGSEFGARADKRIAEHGVKLDRLVMWAGGNEIDFEEGKATLRRPARRLAHDDGRAVWRKQRANAIGHHS